MHAYWISFEEIRTNFPDIELEVRKSMFLEATPEDANWTNLPRVCKTYEHLTKVMSSISTSRSSHESKKLYA